MTDPKTRRHSPLPSLPYRSLSPSIVLLLLLLTVIRGGNFIGMKISLRGLTPLLAAGIRNLIGGVALTGYGLARRRQLLKYTRSQRYTLVLMGGMLAFNFGIVYTGLMHTTASRTAILLNAQPLFVALLSRFFIRYHPLGKRRVFGLIIAFLGVVTVFADKESSYAFRTLRGDAAILVASVVWAMMAIMRKRLAQKVEPTAISTWEMWTSALLILPPGFAIEGTGSVHLTSTVIMALLYCALLGSAFTFATNVYLLKNYDINAVSSFNFLIPIVGAILGVLVLHEVVTMQLCLGTILVTSGIYLINR